MNNTTQNNAVKNVPSNVNPQIAENIRQATSEAYFDLMELNELDLQNLITVSQVGDKTIIRHTVNIPGIPTDTSIRFEIDNGKQGRRYNVFGHHNKLNYSSRTDKQDVALQHYTRTVSEIVKYCFEPPASLSALWP